MKRIISSLLLICTLTLCFVSCGNSEENGNNTNANNNNGDNNKNVGVELTLDNYEDYFDIDTNMSIGHTTMCQYKGNFVDLVKTFKCEIAFSGNTNYEYTNVVFTVKFIHTGPSDFINHYADATVLVRINLAGNGSGSCYVETPVAKTEWDNISQPIYALYKPNSDISVAMKYSSYEVVSVSGTATKN